MLFFSSCIKDGLEDCTTEVSFDYSWNMLGTNAFGSQVDEVKLYLFNQDGVFVKAIADRGDHVADNGYVLKLVDIPVGSYKLVAWANSNRYHEEGAYLEFPQLVPGESTVSQLKGSIRLFDESNKTQKSVLNNYLLGYLASVELTNNSSERVIMPMKKVTNDLRIVMIDTSNHVVTTDDLSVRIEELNGNGIIDYDYSVESSTAMRYEPYYYEKITPREEEYNSNNEKEKLNAVVAEFGFSRLSREHNIRLIIEDKSGKLLLDKNLLDLIHLLKDEGKVPMDMGFQEFLDRKDHFSITVYVDGDTSTWLDTVIIINGWVINLIDIDF